MFEDFDKISICAEDFKIQDKTDSDDLAQKAEEIGKLERRKAEFKLQKYTAKHYLQLTDFENVGFPNNGDMLVAMSVGSFNAYTMILYAFKKYDQIEHLRITTFNMHQSVITALFQAFDDGKIKKLDILLSESVKFRMPKRFDQMLGEFDKHKATGRVRVKYNWNHSKIILIQAGDDKICITGSGNLSDNAQFEQYYISSGCADYDFFAQWIDKEFTGENKKRERILA